MKLDLVFPCQENIDNMPDTDNGKFCQLCTKEVIDFTEMNREEIVRILSKKKSCGIYRPDQLDHINHPIVHIKPKKHILRLALASLSVFVLSIFGCANEAKKDLIKIKPTNSSQKKVDTTSYKKLVGEMPTSKPKQLTEIDDLEDTNEHIEIITTGEIMVNGMMAPVPPDNEDSTAAVFGVVEQMPEFPGGEEAMMKYLEKEITYPKEEAKNNIGGTIYIEFVVEKDGAITKIKLLRGLTESIDAEALRVVRNMPNWNPGKNDGIPVATSFVLPIKFE